MIRAERCIVFHNERKGDIQFPSWIDPSLHNCLIGCMQCQRACPQNKKFLNWIEETEEFSEEETMLLLNGATKEKLSTATLKKLRNIDMLEDIGVFPRNLTVLLDRDPTKLSISDRR